MPLDSLVLSDVKQVRTHVITALSRYWPNDSKTVSELPVLQWSLAEPINAPLRLTEVKLPEWAAEYGVRGSLVVPKEAAASQPHTAEAWRQTNWWLAAFLLLEAWHERVWEQMHGPIHSYSFRLREWDERAWQHAWVNRIGLFLRCWAIQLGGESTLDQMGPLPQPDIHMTHDVDAVAKTLPIRLKQGAFNLFNSARSLSRGKFQQSAKSLGQAIRFVLGQENWWKFDRLRQLEFEAGIRSTFHFHAAQQPKSLKRWVFDPGYYLANPKIQSLVRQLGKDGHGIGLHPSFDSWEDPEQIASQRRCVEQAAGTAITDCRQHWLRFSWEGTWSAQQIAGLTHDRTLMFNDRPGFRNSSAIVWRPYNPNMGESHELLASPTVFMDSHFYDYQSMNANERVMQMRHWVEECCAVRGQVAVLWHPHTLSKDYGWDGGFVDLINIMKDFNTCQ
jgi:hypothetical protein